MYKQNIEKVTRLKIGKTYIVWFSHNNILYEIIETKNRQFYIQQIITDRIAELNAT